MPDSTPPKAAAATKKAAKKAAAPPAEEQPEEGRFQLPAGAELEAAPAVDYQIPEEWLMAGEQGWPDPLYRQPDIDGLEALRRPFDAKHIEKLPKHVLNKEARAENCTVCHGYHKPTAIHLDYVGHAAVTDRLLSIDPLWFWQPYANDPISKLPLMDYDSQNRPVGMWIVLHVAGKKMIGYGTSDPKPDAVKEIIGDAIRNAAMRMGVALSLWVKGEMESLADSPDSLDAGTGAVKQERNEAGAPVVSKAQREALVAAFDAIPEGPERNRAKSDWLAEFGIDKPMKLTVDRHDDAVAWIAARAADYAAPEPAPEGGSEATTADASGDDPEPETRPSPPEAPAPDSDFPVPEGAVTWAGEQPALPGVGTVIFPVADYIAGILEYLPAMSDEQATAFDGWLNDRGWLNIKWDTWPQWALVLAFDKLSAIVEGTDNQEGTTDG